MSPTRRRLINLLIVFSVQALILPVSNFDKLIRLIRSNGTSFQPEFDDTEVYFKYASQVHDGRIPYRDFRVEYPPVAMLLFVPPRLLTANPACYQLLFAGMMYATNAVLVFAVARQVERGEGLEKVPVRLGWYVLCFAFLSRLAISRFDLVPATLAFTSAVAWDSGNTILGGFLAGNGTLTKIFPGLVSLVGSVERGPTCSSTRVRGTIATFAVIMAGVALWFFVGRGGVLDSLRYHTDRGVEYGSLYAGLLLLYAKITGTKIVLMYSYGSLNLEGAGASESSRLVLPLMIGAMALVIWKCRKAQSDLIRYSAAILLAFIIANKVGSPQFLIWILPFAPVLKEPMGSTARRLFAACCLITAGTSQLRSLLGDLNLGIILAFNLKSVLLVWLFAVLLFTGDSRRCTSSSVERVIPV